VNIGFHGNVEVGASQTATTELGKFIGVSVVGVIINSFVLTIFAGILVSVYPAIAQSLAKNAAKLVAVFVALSWNFIGYKFFVFKR
jgi:putative flippase GtrA